MFVQQNKKPLTGLGSIAKQHPLPPQKMLSTRYFNSKNRSMDGSTTRNLHNIKQLRKWKAGGGGGTGSLASVTIFLYGQERHKE
jgi:hypothetical protein